MAKGGSDVWQTDSREFPAKAWLAAIVESSDDAIVGKDLDGIIVSWNRGAEALFGYTAAEAVGRHITMLAPPGREHEMPEILSRLRRGERVEHFETMRRRKDGSLVNVSLTVSPIQDDDGRIIGASKIAHDITERKRTEETLRRLMAEIDHRARNVLSVVQAMVRLTRADTVEQFSAAVGERIAALARIHSQVAENRWSGADLKTLVADGLSPFLCGEGQIRIDGPAVMVTPVATQAIGVTLHELATNAVKHGALSAPIGSVEIRWAPDKKDGTLVLRWKEKNGPPVFRPSSQGLGTWVIRSTVPQQIGGAVKIRWAASGLDCRMTVPAAHIVRI